MRISFTLDGRAVEGEFHPGATLLEALRSAGSVSVKNGCAHGDCGTCAVLVDGRAITACTVFAAQADGSTIETVEGLSTGGSLHPLQAALLDAGGVQCGFCTPGIVLTALELLRRHPRPSEADVRLALAGNLCRCTGYVKIVEGVLAAAERMEQG